MQLRNGNSPRYHCERAAITAYRRARVLKLPRPRSSATLTIPYQLPRSFKICPCVLLYPVGGSHAANEAERLDRFSEAECVVVAYVRRIRLSICYSILFSKIVRRFACHFIHLRTTVRSVEDGSRNYSSIRTIRAYWNTPVHSCQRRVCIRRYLQCENTGNADCVRNHSVYNVHVRIR